MFSLCISETQARAAAAAAAGIWTSRAGHSEDNQSSKGHEDIVHFVWVKCVCICVTCLAGRARGHINFLSLGLVIN